MNLAPRLIAAKNAAAFIAELKYKEKSVTSFGRKHFY
jgi:hypothetical protein